ncbi:Holliday junction resolvase RecU [Virgibacillus sp. CBA3643]|uniref:Holliday junction resolvase RecU n=1 Tax=Virgibacillus sp. CBA3643 TaxID=2942278 RepID=UPI0035A301F1
MSQGKRGKALENMIEHTNSVYRSKGLALVHKEPTPWNVNYNPKKRVNIAFPEKKGTVDFEGVSKGRSIAFDAKTTENKTSFPLKNIADHQINYLRDHQKQEGFSFIIVEFAKSQERFLLTFDQLHSWWVEMFRGGRKSIPYQYFKENCKQIRSRNGVAVDYLEHIS